jgi:hypothetical protein
MEPKLKKIKGDLLVPTLIAVTSETPTPTEEKFLDLANMLENGEFEGIELDEDAVSIVTAVLRGEDIPELE